LRDDTIWKFDILIKKGQGIFKEVVMDQKDCGSWSRFELTLLCILLNALAVTGCATLGDIEEASQRTQASLNAYKKESRENQAEMGKQINSLSKEISNLKNQDKEFNRDQEDIIKENRELRASLLAVTATIQGFLSAEKKRYEEGLRWIENANKSVGGETAKGPEANPLPEFPATSLTDPSQGPPSGTQAAGTVPSPSPPPGTPGAVAAAASVAEEPPPELDESERPTIEIVEIVIDPPKVERHAKFTVTVKYELEGNPDGPKLKYLEEVVLLKGTLSIQNLKDMVERAPGTISFTRTIEVPAAAPTGPPANISTAAEASFHKLSLGRRFIRATVIDSLA